MLSQRVSFRRNNDTLCTQNAISCLSVSLTDSGRGGAPYLRPPYHGGLGAAQRPRAPPQAYSATMSKRCRDVKNRVYRLAGYSITANHWPYRCNAIRRTLVFQPRATAKEEVASRI